MFTHIGDACRAAGLLPIAMPFSVRHSIAAVESEPARTPLLPVELTMVNDLPFNLDGPRRHVPYGRDPQLLLSFLDDRVVAGRRRYLDRGRVHYGCCR